MIETTILLEKKYSFEEYLAFEEQARDKHEYHNGYVVPKFRDGGVTGNHSILCSSIGAEIDFTLRKSKKNCTTFNSDMKVWIGAFNKSVYPDVSVACGKPDYTNNNKVVLKNPMLIIEVLSKNTKGYDKSDKFAFYRSIPSFKEYVIIYQTIPRVETWYKEAEDLWRIGSAFGLDQSIYLKSIDATFSLQDIYERVEGLNLDKEIALEKAY